MKKPRQKFVETVWFSLLTCTHTNTHTKQEKRLEKKLCQHVNTSSLWMVSLLMILSFLNGFFPQMFFSQWLCDSITENKAKSFTVYILKQGSVLGVQRDLWAWGSRGVEGSQPQPQLLIQPRETKFPELTFCLQFAVIKGWGGVRGCCSPCWQPATDHCELSRPLSVVQGAFSNHTRNGAIRKR